MNLQKESHFLEDRVSNPALVKCAVKSISKEVRTTKIPVTSNKKAISPSFIRETIARSVHRANNREFASEIPANFQLPAWRISAALVNESPVISFLRKPLSVHKSRDAEPRKHCHTFVRRLSTSSGVWPRSLLAWWFFFQKCARVRAIGECCTSATTQPDAIDELETRWIRSLPRFNDLEEIEPREIPRHVSNPGESINFRCANIQP